jgi:hypothetical protein
MKKLDKLGELINELKKTKELLHDVHLQVGGYGHGQIYPKTLKAINELFGFDDSRDTD